MTTWILGALGIYFVQCMLGPATRWLGSGKGSVIDAVGPRDVQPPQSVVGGRFERAAANMQEALFLFLPMALLVEMKGIAAGTALFGAKLFIAARLVYVPAYASGIFGVRSIVWMAGHAGLVMMATVLLSVV